MPSVSGGFQGRVLKSGRARTVYVDGRRIGNTPQMNISLPAGRHEVRLINPDFNIRETVRVNIRAGQVETLIQRLTPG